MGLGYNGSSTTTFASVAATSTLLAGINGNRATLTIVNDSNENIYISLGNAAVLNSGILLTASGGSYEINSTNLYTGPVYGISTSGSKNATIQEVSYK